MSEDNDFRASMTADEYVQIIKNALKSLSSGAALAAIFFYAPFLNIPIVRDLIKWIVGLIVGKVLDGGEMLAFFLYIDLRVNAEGRDFAKAAHKNYLAQIGGSPEEKAAAEKELIDAFNKFAKFASNALAMQRVRDSSTECPDMR